METPKVFISYSWHPAGNQLWVIKLAERLMSDGIEVVLDVWDLKDGHDKNVFMERMVNDSSIAKVLVICNKDYSEKANRRTGGVGIESTIISSDVYNKCDQNKFIPVIREKDDKGDAYTPTYMKSLVYIDFSDDDKFEENYYHLLRTIVGQPLYVKPSLGKLPSYLSNPTNSFLPTAGKLRRLNNAVLEGKSNVRMFADDYIDAFVSSLPSYKIDYRSIKADEVIGKVESSIQEMTVLRDDFIGFISTIIKTDICKGELFIDLFEKILQILADNGISLLESDSIDGLVNDNYRYFLYDIFLSFTALMVNREKFDVLKDVVTSRFCIEENAYRQEVSYQTILRFRKYNYTLNKYKRENTNRISIVADMITKNSTIISSNDLIKADLLLYYLSLIYGIKENFYNYWYPELNIYSRFIEIMPRLASKRYFEKAKILFGVNSVDDYRKMLDSVEEPQIGDSSTRIPKIKYGLSYENVSSIN